MTTSNNKHNYKLTSLDKKDILTNYVLDKSTNNVLTICNKYNISRRTLYDIVNKATEEEKNEIINQSIKEFRDNFTKKSVLIIEKMLDRISNQLDNTDEKIQLSQLMTSLGIIYDKLRLNENQSTSNTSLNINIKIE